MKKRQSICRSAVSPSYIHDPLIISIHIPVRTPDDRNSIRKKILNCKFPLVLCFELCYPLLRRDTYTSITQ